MGLGKTLTMISLILATVDQRANDSDESSSDDEWLSRKKHKSRFSLLYSDTQYCINI